MRPLRTGRLSVERLQLEITDLPPSLQGLKLVQLSDLHFDGIGLSQALLQEAIDVSNAATPDLVVLTGDMVTDDPAWIHQLVPWLKMLQSRYGTFAALGNHDNYRWRTPQGVVSTRLEITEALQTVDISVLWNQIAYPLGPELPLVGLADYWSSAFDPAPVMAQLDPAVPRIVLAHNPDSADALQQWRVDLQLSGHTHGGQVVIPGIGTVSQGLATLYRKSPRWLKQIFPLLKECHQVVKHWEWAQGLHSVGNNLMYVNRGLGTYFPGRLFCPPEVTVITLVTTSQSHPDEFLPQTKQHSKRL